MAPKPMHEIEAPQYNYQGNGTATVPQPRISKRTKVLYEVYEARSSAKMRDLRFSLW